jgi:hypothetical protein
MVINNERYFLSIIIIMTCFEIKSKKKWVLLKLEKLVVNGKKQF